MVINISDADYAKLIGMLHYKAKIHDYFGEPVTKDVLGSPIIMSLEESLIRTLLKVLNITTKEQLDSEYNRLKDTRYAYLM